MSTLKLENIKHENSSTNNMVMDSDGSTRTTGTLKADTRLQVGNSSITQAYPQTNFGYVADFQASAGTQTYISIAAPGTSLGDNGVVIGEDATDTYITQRGNKNIKLATQDVTRMNISGDGRVTMPNQPFIELHGNQPSRITNHGTPVVWTHFGLQASTGGMTWNSSTGRITVPVAGKYIFLGKFYQWIDNATNQNVITRKNGNPIAEYHSDYANLGNGSNTDHVIVTADIVDMAASDYIEYRVNSDIYGGYPHTNLQAFLLG